MGSIRDNLSRLLLLGRIFVRRMSLRGHLRLVNFAFKRFFLRDKTPLAVMVALTYRCQCNCVHCSVSGMRESSKDEISTSQVRGLIDDCAKAGILKIGFTGGEPLLRSDILELVRYAHGKGLCVSLDTNGILLDGKMASGLKDSGVTNINVSLDHAQARVHDRLRRYRGCFDAALKGINNCVENKIPCTVSTYLTDRSVEKAEIGRIVGLSRKLKADAVRVLFPVYSGKFCGKKRPVLSKENKESFFRNTVESSYVYSESPLFDYFSKRVECSAEKKLSVYVTAYGDLRYCYYSSGSLGNIREEKFSALLSNNSYFDRNRKIDLECASCAR